MHLHCLDRQTTNSQIYSPYDVRGFHRNTAVVVLTRRPYDEHSVPVRPLRREFSNFLKCSQISFCVLIGANCWYSWDVSSSRYPSLGAWVGGEVSQTAPVCVHCYRGCVHCLYHFFLFDRHLQIFDFWNPWNKIQNVHRLKRQNK